MQYSEKYNVCVYNTRIPERITQIISSAKIIKPGAVAVPCNLWEMQVMRSLGYAAMSPMLKEYDWPGRHKPFAHQL